MAAYNNLTTAHFSRIIDYLVFTYLGPVYLEPKWQVLDTIKTPLIIAGVCKSWRNSVLPLAYKTLCIDASSEPYLYLWFHGKDKKVYGQSNFDLIASNQFSCMTEKWKIMAPGINVLHEYVKNKEAFVQGYYNWTSITSLVLDTKIYRDNEKEDSGYDTTLKLLERHVPNITCLEFNHNSSLPYNGQFYYNLVNTYSDKLCIFKTSGNILWQNIQPLNNLRVLSIGLNNSTKYLFSVINLQRLENLTLYDIPQTFKWDIFSLEADEKVNIEFSQLQALCLKYTFSDTYNSRNEDNNRTNSDDIMPKVQLSYPVLKSLFIDGEWHDDDSRYVSHVFPDKMSSVLVCGSEEHINLFSRLDIKQCSNLTIISYDKQQLGNLNYEAPEHCDALSAIFGQSNKFNSVTALLNIPRKFTKQSYLSWNNLQCLKMDNDIAFESLVLFIKKLPELRVFHAYHVSYQYRPGFVLSDRVKRLQQRLKPFNSKLQELEMLCSSRCKFNYNVWCLDRLLLRLVNLRLFKCDSPTYKSIGMFNSLFQKEYPHVTNMDIVGSFRYNPYSKSLWMYRSD